MTKNVWLSFDAFLNRLEQCFKERGQHKYLVSLNSSRNDSTCIDQSDYVRREIIDELAKQRVAADGLDISYEPYLLILDLGRSNYQSIAELIMTVSNLIQDLILVLFYTQRKCRNSISLHEFVKKGCRTRRKSYFIR